MNFAFLKVIPKVAVKVKGQVIKYTPEIMTIGGILIEGVGVVLSCQAAVKMDDILTESKSEIDKIKEGWSTPENRDLLAQNGYFEKDYKRELTIQYAKNIAAAVKPWILPVSMLVIGNGLILGSHIKLRKEHAAAVGAYTALDEAFRRYRKRVVDKYGRDEDLYFAHGVEKIEVEEKVKDPETGKTKKEKRTVYVKGEDPSIYAKFFDEHCSLWTKDPTANLLTLKCVQEYANTTLHTRGHLFLNEVYDALGIPRTTSGQMVGWVDGLGDSYVDFGLYEVRNRDFINGEERSILLDFNVDGVIVDKI